MENSVEQEIVQNHMANTSYSLFDNGETEYRYFSEVPMDNQKSMDWFITYVGIAHCVKKRKGSTILVKSPDSEDTLQIVASHYYENDLFSHKFQVTIYKQ